ncbi:MAG: nucleoside triphosphate pyrophosphohydrolase [Actinobacteria bacterium]|nr:nucleoside triphosphate pyrophosphohydrolase [Actinomycetota bacterium]
MEYNLDEDDLKNIGRIDNPEKLFTILVNVMKKLRSREGCAWDREQDHKSIKKNLIEEAYETLEAIDGKDPVSLKEELGDMLLQIVFHSQIAAENNEFDISQVLKGIIEKLLRRHPHVFGGKNTLTSSQVLANWESIKKEERKKSSRDSDSIFSGIPKTLPALHYAFEIQNRASRLKFDWEDHREIYFRMLEELNELKIEIEKGDMERAYQEIGDLLFSIVNYSRHLKIDCELSLKNTGKKFVDRFKLMEKYSGCEGAKFAELSPGEKDRLWEEAKKKIP